MEFQPLTEIISEKKLNLDELTTANILGCPISRIMDGSPVTPTEIDKLHEYVLENGMGKKASELFPTFKSIYEKLDITLQNYAEIGRVLKQSRENVRSRCQNGSVIKLDETIILYRYLKTERLYNMYSVFVPLLKKHVPELFKSDLDLAAISDKPWRELDVFLPSEEAADGLFRLMTNDVRTTLERQLRIYVPGSDTKPEHLITVVKNRDLRLRCELRIFRVEEISSFSGFALLDDTHIVLPAESGFTPVIGETAVTYGQAIEKIVKTARLVWQESLSLVGPPPVSPPDAADGHSVVLDFEGQLGGGYRLEFIRDEAPNPDSDSQGSDEVWRMRLSVLPTPTTQNRCVQIVDQAGRVIIDTVSNNLPWQGFWPDQNQPVQFHIDDLLISEFES